MTTKTFEIRAVTAPPITLITARQGWFDWRLDQLWRYRDLISLFVWRDFIATYKQTILGPAWHVLRPLITTLVFTLVFGTMAGLSTDGAPKFLFYMVGNIAWTYFSNALDGTSKTFVANAALLGKVYFHRMVIPVSIVVSNLIAFAIQVLILFIAMAYYRATGAMFHVTQWAWFTPLLLLLLVGYSLGGGVVVSALTTRYRDLSHLVTFGLQLFMYLTPVIYPVSAVPAQVRWAVRLNPLTPIFEGLRLAFLGVGVATPSQLAISSVGMLATLGAGLLLLTRVERTFMDTV